MGTIVELFGLLPEALKPEISFKILSVRCYGMQLSAEMQDETAAVVTAVGCDHSDHSCQTLILCVQ